MQHVVVIVAPAEDHLVVGVGDPRADGRGLREIEGRSVGLTAAPPSDERLVDGRELIGLDLRLVAQHVSGALARQVEVGVVRQVDDRGLVGRCGVVDPEPLVVQEVDDPGRERAGVPLLAGHCSRT